MIQRSAIQQFMTCRRCQKKTNTEVIGVGERYDRLTFVGWCWDCMREYAYNVPIEDVHDKEGRI